MTPIARINKLLAAAGRPERLVRNTSGGSYYYLTDPSTESLHCYSLRDTPGEHTLATEYVEEQLSKIDGKPFSLTAPVGAPAVADDGARAAKIEDVPAGEFVKRKADATKVYKRSEYIRSEGKYMLRDQDDISRSVLVKKGTIVFVGFTY